MAYYDVLASSSYGRFNRKLARMTNLQTAVYWSEILDIISRVVKKKKFDQNGFFKLDRNYIINQTGIQKEEQLEIDSILSELRVLESDQLDSDKVRVNLETMEKLLVSDSVTIIEKAKKKTEKVEKKSAAEGKRIGIINRLKKALIDLEPDQNVRSAYEAWIEVVYDKGVNKVPQLKLFVDQINAFTTDQKKKLEVINLATSLGYREASWAINRSTSSYSQSQLGTRINTEQKTSTGIKEDLSF